VCSSDLYLACVPFFFKSWNALGYEPYLLYIGETLPAELRTLQKIHTIVQFNPPPGFHSAYIAQSIRLYWTSLVSTDLDRQVLITDIDIVPLSNRFFKEELLSYDKTKFHAVDYMNTLKNYGYLPMCYNIATVRLWRALNGISTLAQLQEKYTDPVVYSGTHGGTGWFTDQIVLTTLFKQLGTQAEYHNNTDRRLERWDINVGSVELMDQLKRGVYRDYHIFANQVSSMEQRDRTQFVCDYAIQCL
jgi:hypothetical protein